MNWDQIEGNWKQTKGKLREKWGKLTDDDLQQSTGTRERLIGALQERYGLAKEKAAEQLDELIASLQLDDDQEESATAVPPRQAESTPTGHAARRP